ncbi:uncharacterized protein LOC34621353 [Cyclospora cayetanensis]|nr:uncharacterized protein LOC34621353 [Cyclospora cayetanensis]
MHWGQRTSAGSLDPQRIASMLLQRRSDDSPNPGASARRDLKTEAPKGTSSASSAKPKLPTQQLWKGRTRIYEAKAELTQQKDFTKQPQRATTPPQAQQQEEPDTSAAVQATAAVYRAKAQTKVAVRHLPPTVSESTLLQSLPPTLSEALLSSSLIQGKPTK